MGFTIEDGIFYHGDWPEPDPHKSESENYAVRVSIMLRELQNNFSYLATTTKAEPLPSMLARTRAYQQTDDFKRMHHPDPAIRQAAQQRFNNRVDDLMQARMKTIRGGNG